MRRSCSNFGLEVIALVSDGVSTNKTMYTEKLL